MHGQRVVIVVSAGAAAGSAFLPWINAPIVGSVVGIGGNVGWVVMSIAGFALLCGLVGTRAESLSATARALILLCGLGIAGIGLAKFADVHQLKQPKDGEVYDRFQASFVEMISAGVGLYVMVAAGLALIFLSVLSPSKASPTEVAHPS